MKKKSLIKFLFKYNMIFQPILSAFASFFFGLHLIKIEGEITGGTEWYYAFFNVGVTSEIIIAFLFLVLLFIYHYCIIIKPIKSFEKNKKSIIDDLLSSITRALFFQYGGDLEVSATVQACDHKKNTREVVYQYNTIEKSFQTMDLFFGDVGEQCVHNKDYLTKEFTHSDWLNNTEEYRRLVPHDLRIIFARPIFNSEHIVIAVLEIDIYENTTESDQGSTKLGYLTNDVKSFELIQDLSTREIKRTLKEWASSIELLMDQ